MPYEEVALMLGVPPGLRAGGTAPRRNHLLYVRDFDELARTPEPAPEAPAQNAHPRITAEDVSRAWSEGHKAGLEEARTERAAVEAALQTAAMTQIADAMTGARQAAAAEATAQAAAIGRTILALLRAALPATSSRLAAEEIEALLASMLPALAGDPTLQVAAHPSMCTRLADHRAQLPHMTLVPDDTLDPTDVVLSWTNGGARRSWTEIWPRITRALEPCNLPELNELLEDIGHGG